MRFIGKLTTICEEAAEFLHTSDIPQTIPVIQDLLVGIGRRQASYSLVDPGVSDIPEYMLEDTQLCRLVLASVYCCPSTFTSLCGRSKVHPRRSLLSLFSANASPISALSSSFSTH